MRLAFPFVKKIITKFISVIIFVSDLISGRQTTEIMEFFVLRLTNALTSSTFTAFKTF